MIASGSSYYGVVRFWDKRQSKCLQVGTVHLQKCDVLHVNTVVISWLLIFAVLPAVCSPFDQPCVLPEVQQLSPVCSPGEHARDSRLQLEPHLHNARAETIPLCVSLHKAVFLENVFSQLLYVSHRIKLKRVGRSAFFYILLVSTTILVFKIFVIGNSG